MRSKFISLLCSISLILALISPALAVPQGTPPSGGISNSGGVLTKTHIGVIKPYSWGPALTDTNFYYETVSLSSISCSGTTVTAVTSAVHGLQTGGTATIAGVTPSGYNGVFSPVTVTNTTTFTFSIASCPGTETVLGSVSAARTAVMVFEVPDDFTAVKLIFGDQSGANSYVLTNASVSGSASLGVASDTTGIPGFSAWNGSGTAATALCGGTNTTICWSPVTWGNNGLDSTTLPGFLPLSTPANGIACQLASQAAANATALVCNSYPTGASIGQQVIIPATSGVYPTLPSEPVYVTSLPAASCGATCSVGIGPLGVTNIIPTSVTAYLLPLTFTVTPSLSPPLTNLAYSDWTPVQSYQRNLIDFFISGYALSGPAAFAPNTTINGSATYGTASVNGHSESIVNVPLSLPTVGLIPANTAFSECRSDLTLSADTAPTFVLPFSSTVGIVPGMYVVYGGAPTVTNSQSGAPAGRMVWNTPAGIGSSFGHYDNTVASVSANTSVTTTTPLPAFNDQQTSIAAQAFSFVLPTATTQSASIGSSSLTIATGLTIANGMGVNGIGIAAGTTVSSYNSGTGVLTLSTPTTVSATPLNAAINLIVTYTQASSATVAPRISINSTTNTHWLFEDSYISTSGFPARDPIWDASATTISAVFPSNSVVPSGSAITVCKDFVTVTTAIPGATALQVAAPNRLLLVRVNFGSTNVQYSSRPRESLANRQLNYNFPIVDSGYCAFGTDGVLAPSAITSATSQCARANGVMFPFAIEVLGARQSIVVAAVYGDSTWDPQTSKNFGHAGAIAAQLSSPNLPVYYAECGWGGALSPLFGEAGKQCIKAFNPTVALIAGSTFNDPTDQNSINHFNQFALSLIGNISGMPIIVSSYPRQTAGCNTVATSGETLRQQQILYWDAVGLNQNTLSVYDSYLNADPTNSGYFTIGASQDCVHPFDPTVWATATGVVALILSRLPN